MVALAAVALVAGCGDDDDLGSGVEQLDGALSEQPADDAVSESGESGDSGDTLDAGGGGVVIGTPTLEAEPGQAWAEVEGERLLYEAAGSINVQCTIGDDQVTVNFQTPEGRDLLIQGAPQDGTWFLNATFARGGDNVRYSTASSFGDGVFTIGDGVLGYEGSVERVDGNDVANAETLDARLAVNCASPGGDPTAMVGGQTYVFPISGAQSVQCEVAPEAVDVRINRLALDDLQLEISARLEGEQWIGAVVVYAGEERFTSTLSPDGAGLAIDGGSVTYEGTFASIAGDPIEGSASVTCA